MTPAARIAEVLLPLALAGSYSYVIPEGMDLAPGDHVEVPLGPRARLGVVWAVKAEAPEGTRLKPVTARFDFPPLSALHRRFVDWLAAYYLEPPGMVLRMVLRCPGLFAERQGAMAYRATGHSPRRMTPQRQRVLEVAAEGFALRAGELAEAASVSVGVIKALVADGALEAMELPPFQPFAAPDPEGGRLELSADQGRVAEALRQSVAAGGHSVTLLDGVTGSGKTEVYFAAMAEALRQGRQVLLLLPEIALTPSFLARVEARFEAAPAAWHSGLRPRERERTWRGVALGEAKIVVGARSALFLPWVNLGLIVVDEEHEGAYKQEDGVTYHARDMAVLYGSLGRFPVILSSATPSLESLVNASRGRYHTLKLTDRHGRAELPDISLIDLRHDPPAPGRWLSPPLLAAVTDTLTRGQQVLLFLNRRGYAPLTLCRACGHRMDCPHCAASLVEHRFRKQLQCHHCGHLEPVPRQCPACGVEGKLVPVGPGIERLAEEVRELFPAARLAILSSDLARGTLLTDTLSAVEQGAVDLIIGTQLVAKGHHFPKLTLAGVVDADLALETSDPRGAERTWALLAQVAGRAGRGEHPGRALIQTHVPHHPLMQALAHGNRDEFLAQEMRVREQAGLPPYGRLASLIISGAEAGETERFARDLARRIPDAAGFTVLGPAPAPLHLVRGRHRWRFLVKAPREANIQAHLRQWLGGIAPRGSLALQIDIDPYNFL